MLGAHSDDDPPARDPPGSCTIFIESGPGVVFFSQMPPCFELPPDILDRFILSLQHHCKRARLLEAGLVQQPMVAGGSI